MRMTELIQKKRDGLALTAGEWQAFVTRYTAGDIPDYQASALMMAIYFQGMTSAETTALTLSMASSGEQADLSGIPGLKVDKHSTGGVGDKTTLIIAPIAAACGVPIAKMSGRGLGHTGGTVDKLESIPGLQTSLTQGDFLRTVQKTGLSVIGQSGNLCPADKKLYALRDVTATVESLPLIAASIMSKKIAAGADRILLDVKLGSGAFMKTQEEAEALAKTMVEIGTLAGRKTVALLTDMEIPLGRKIGNALEIQEVCAVLQNRGPKDLREICLTLAANMIHLGERAPSLSAAEALASRVLENGEAMERFATMVAQQGGDAAYVRDADKLPLSPIVYQLKSPASGYLSGLNAQACGQASVLLGAGRQTKEDIIDHGAGVVLEKEFGSWVQAGEPLATLYTSRETSLPEAVSLLAAAYQFSQERPQRGPMVVKRISAET